MRTVVGMTRVSLRKLAGDILKVQTGTPAGLWILAALLLTGCNETGFHCLNVNIGRDTRDAAFHDLRLARSGQGCPRCDGTIQRSVQAQRSTYHCDSCQF